MFIVNKHAVRRGHFSVTHTESGKRRRNVFSLSGFLPILRNDKKYNGLTEESKLRKIIQVGCSYQARVKP